MNEVNWIMRVCKAASARGLLLKLEQTNDGFAWQWAHSNVVFARGLTDANTKQVALFFACQDVEPYL